MQSAASLSSCTICILLISFLLSFCPSPSSSQGLHIVDQLNLDDQSDRWLSKSVFGQVYSFLSTTTLWWGGLNDNKIDFIGARIPKDLGPELAITLGFGFNPVNQHNVAQFVVYSREPGIDNLAIVVVDFVTRQWSTEVALTPPAPDNVAWQALIPNSNQLEHQNMYFLISIDYVISVKSSNFTQAAMLSLKDSFTNQYPVYNTTGVIFYKDRLFIARTGSLDQNNNKRSQIVEIQVDTDYWSPSFGALNFNHVTYLPTNCFNMFGWGNFLFWEQQDQTSGTLYGWDFVNKVLVNQKINFGPNQQFGSATGVNNTIGQAMFVAGDPTGQTGYTVYASSLYGETLSSLGQLSITNGDKLPQLGMQTVDKPGLSVLMAGHNATGFGKITWFAYY